MTTVARLRSHAEFQAAKQATPARQARRRPRWPLAMVCGVGVVVTAALGDWRPEPPGGNDAAPSDVPAGGTEPPAFAGPLSSTSVPLLAGSPEKDTRARRRAAAMDPTDATLDATWDAILRDDRDLATLLALDPDLVADGAYLQLLEVVSETPATQNLAARIGFLKPLLRSTTFNPRDRWLSPEVRTRLLAVITEHVRMVTPKAAEVRAVAAREFKLAAAAGRALPVGLADNGALNLAQLGSDPVRQRIGDRPFGVAAGDMPQTCAARTRMRAAACTMVASIAAEFAAVGTLTEGEAAKCTQAATAAAASH